MYFLTTRMGRKFISTWGGLKLRRFHRSITFPVCKLPRKDVDEVWSVGRAGSSADYDTLVTLAELH